VLDMPSFSRRIPHPYKEPHNEFSHSYRSGPRYQLIHERLRDTVGDRNLPIFWGHSYFLDTQPDQFLEMLRLT